MPALVVVGAQWGDEGKGKIVDLLAEKAAYVVRYQGGANAGHEVIVKGQSFVMHLIPSGILHAGKKCVIGNGVVLDAEALAKEINELRSRGVKVSPANLLISPLTHLTFSFHRLLDGGREGNTSARKIGTTKRGIGPTYADKAARVGIRAGDLTDAAYCRQVLTQNLAEKNHLLKLHGGKAIPVAQALAEARAWIKTLQPFLADTVEILYEASLQKKNILLEGAQGTLLDVDFGTYPYVSASNASAGGASSGSGLGPTAIGRVLGVCKAYTTRVGEGPFPTEFSHEMDQMIREKGDEFGRTTGRARRCGWLDLVGLRHAVMVNGLRELAITKLDVLDDLKEICIANGYTLRGKKQDRFPTSVSDLEAVKPSYVRLPGWQSSTRKARKVTELPVNARRYLDKISQLAGVPVSIVSVGPDREQTLFADRSSFDYKF
jgi:adenylosuccinate synthase